eukprot:g11112.t1
MSAEYIMIDANFNPTLIEVNASPSLTANTKADYEMKFATLDDVMTILDLEKYLNLDEVNVNDVEPGGRGGAGGGPSTHLEHSRDTTGAGGGTKEHGGARSELQSTNITRVGGFDLIYKGGPVEGHVESMLGARNDRDEQLKQLAEEIWLRTLSPSPASPSSTKAKAAKRADEKKGAVSMPDGVVDEVQDDLDEGFISPHQPVHTSKTDSTEQEEDDLFPMDDVPVGKMATAPAHMGGGRKRSFSISMFPQGMKAQAGGRAAALGRRMSLSASHHSARASTIDLGAVVEFSRFSFDQFEIRDTDTDSVNPTSTQIYGKMPTHLAVFWRTGHSDLLLFGRKLCSVLMLYNALFATFYLGFFHPLVGDRGLSRDEIAASGSAAPTPSIAASSIDTNPEFGKLRDLFIFDLLCELCFVVFELVLPLRTSIVVIQEGREYVELSDIKRLLFGKRAYWYNWVSLLSNLLWIDAVTGNGERTFCTWFGLLRFLRCENLRRERQEASQGGVVISPYRQGVWAGIELVFMMFFLVHVFAITWFKVLYDTDRGTTYSCDIKEVSLWKFYILALRDAVLLFSASPPTSMTDRDDSSVVLCITLLRPIGAFAEAVIFARIVLIEQRMMILKSKTLEQQAAINAAMSQINLPENLHRRINMYHQFLEIQHDKQACDLLYTTSSKALVLEIKICLFAALIEKAPFFRDLHPSGVAEILDNFAEEVFSPGDYIIRFGQEGFEMYFILRGLCDVVVIRRNSMPGPNGIPTARNKLVVAQKREGDYFGETALVQKGQKRTAYVRAQTYTVAEKLTADALNNIVKKKYDSY